ncbi:leucyl aminopeptidase [Acidiferrobacter sp.]|uniref:leucyl aminopeptidase n=1 Tax=Acidiferrobacter sp. TaxID=1872107 RepID=UPI00262ADB83|nr:leucyl aminopeptidase [Acidiferrobacter sp.]
MEYALTDKTPDQLATECLIVGIHENSGLSEAAAAVDRALGGAISAIVQRGDIEGKPGQTLPLVSTSGKAERVLLVGMGAAGELKPAQYKEAVARAAQAAADLRAATVANFLPSVPVKDRSPAWALEQAVVATEDALYRFDRLKTRAPARPVPQSCIFGTPVGPEAAAREALAAGSAIARAVSFAKDLANLPGNMCTPSYLAEQAQGLGTRAGLKVSVLEKTDMETLGMGALLAVARGTHEPAKLIVLEYHGNGTSAPIALVGKGVTFDAGGISLKPPANMDEMKFDMCGAATVLATVQAAAELTLPINLIGIVPATENLPGGSAIKPGDIVTSLSGQTIEILNTDAEGRLILCDALSYAERFKPAAVIDIATLTGACVIALGAQAGGLMSNDEALAHELEQAGQEAADRIWPLPLWEEYQKQLDSNFADMANIGGREAGTITAACFLSRFTEAYPWAHLDIAGIAYKSGKEKGATGRPIPLLVEFLRRRARLS